jgi:hypothetical protein
MAGATLRAWRLGRRAKTDKNNQTDIEEPPQPGVTGK